MNVGVRERVVCAHPFLFGLDQLQNHPDRLVLLWEIAK